jgi:predicted enzyme related to lactoylglutathione lyase
VIGVRVSHVEVAIDGVDVDQLAAFWAAALGYDHHGTFEQYRSLTDPDGRGPKLIVQQVPEGRSTKNRVHLDLHVPDVESEVNRLVSLGATRLDVEPIREAGTYWIRMLDPDGNEFCVVHEND